MISSLNIVGNGFDLAHGLPTTYQNFTDNYYDKSPSLQKFKSILGNSTLSARDPEELIVEWNDFENVIGHITNDYFIEHMMTYENIGSPESEAIFEGKLKILYEAYEGIISDFTEYLRSISFEKVKPLPNIKPIFKESDYSITFNYTDTARIYQNNSTNVYHIHGSLKEQEKIVLGYQSRMTRPDFEAPSSSKYNKKKLRDMLSFQRFLRVNHKDISPDMFIEEVELFQKIIDMSSTGRGYDEITDISSPFTRAFRQLDKKTRSEFENNFLTNLKQIVILGHSLKADEDLFYYIFENSRKLKNIILFTYAGEELAQIKEKERLIQSFFGNNPDFATCNIEVIPYIG